MWRVSLIFFMVIVFLLSCTRTTLDYYGHCRVSRYELLGLNIHLEQECIEEIGTPGTAKPRTGAEKIVDDIIDEIISED